MAKDCEVWGLARTLGDVGIECLLGVTRFSLSLSA